MESKRLIWQDHYDHPTPWEQPFPPLTLPEMFEQSAARHGAKPIMDFYGRAYRYEEALDGVRRFAEGLAALGIAKGDRIGLFLPNVPHYIAAYYGAMKAGAIVVNFSPLYTAEELIHQAQDSGIRMLVTLSAKQLFTPALEVMEACKLDRLIVGSIAGALPTGKSLMYRLFKGNEVADVPDDPRIVRFSDLLGKADGRALPDVSADDIALLQYTGGTTGRPKGAMLTHQNLTANARQVNMIDPDPDQPDRILGVLPFFHVFANTAVLNRTINHGGLIVMLPRFDAKQALAAVTRTGITSLPGVPTMFQALLDEPTLAKTDFTSLRVCISGGAPLPRELKDKFEAATGAKLVEGYGLTESSGVVSANPYAKPGKSGTIGQPIPGTVVKLVHREDATKPAPEGEPGEIVFSGPQTMRGYWNRPDAAADTFTIDGFLRTGDVGVIDAEGYIRVVDRIKDMIAVGGFKVFPSQVEQVLYRHPQVREALVIGIPDAYLGERPKAFVTLEANATIDGAALMAWLNPQLGKHERVVEVELRESLPKTLVGKLSRKELVAEEKAKAASAG
jgi:long-chain acyl-CoA synthetase